MPPPQPPRDGGILRARLLTLAALAGLLALAAGVVFVLPRAVDDAALQPQSSAPAPKAVEKAVEAPELAPAAEVDAAREAAQRSLGDALGRQARLEVARVSEWGGDAYAAAVAAVAAGDQAFAAGDFAAANDAYRSASELMQRIEAGKAERFATALRDGARALESQDAASAMAAFRMAVAMEPSSEAARSGLARAGTFQQVLDQYQRALQAEAAGELEQALSLLQHTVSLDAAFDDASTALARVQDAIEERDFRNAMSRTLSALADGDRAAAGTALARARALRPSDPSVADARRRLALADERSRLQRLEKQALALEAEERWQEAAVAYEKALKVDSQAAFARRGLARSGERRRLNERVDAYLQAPQLLQADEPLHDARLLLEAASNGDEPGPGLAAKLARLDALVRAALTPVKVVVQSDGATEVSILRVSRLGPVITRAMVLRPGSYVATGSRAGYRDVRVAFTVPPGEQAVTVTVICTEPV